MRRTIYALVFATRQRAASACALLACILVTSCAAANSGARTGPATPVWFSAPPKSTQSLYFVGSAAGAADEQTARDLALQKALSELTVYCGANITSDFSSSEIERDGALTQSVSLTVDISGDEMTIREAVVKKSTSGAASDGTWDAFVLLEWPRAQYRAVLDSQRDRAHRALTVFLEAEAAANALKLADARAKATEARRILGPMRAQTPLSNSKYANTALLYDAIRELEQTLETTLSERRKVLHVAVVCSKGRQLEACPSHRVGAAKASVSAAGFKVSTTQVDPTIAAQILDSTTPESDPALRSAGYVLSVRYSVDRTEEDSGFVFVYCGARGVLYDTDSNRIVQAHEVKPLKGGHVNFAGARDKSCSAAEKEVLAWTKTTLQGFE